MNRIVHTFVVRFKRNHNESSNIGVKLTANIEIKTET